MTASPRSQWSAAAVLGIGASSAIGYTLRSIQLTMAAGLRNFQDGMLTDDNGEPVRTSRVPDLDEMAPRPDRIEALTRWAVIDLLKQVTAYIPNTISVHVGTPDDAPGSDLEAIRRGLEDGSRGLIDPDRAVFRAFDTGRIAFRSAMASAIRSFDETSDEVALVVAADTRCTWEAIDTLAGERRLLTTEDDGTIPGEGAVVALVASPRSAAAFEHGRFFVAAPSFAEDQFEALRQSPLATNGLGRAFRTLREHPFSGAVRPAAVISFETGELFFTRAFTTGYLRNVELMPEPLQHELIASNVGDTGAAAAGLALARADWMLNRRRGERSERILMYGHADDGRCAAAITIRRQAGGPSS